MQNVIQKFGIQGGVLLIALILSGCAATHSGSRPPPGVETTPLSQNRAIPHTGTRSITGGGVTGSAAPAAPVAAAAPASKAADKAPAQPADTGKAQIYAGTGVFVKPPAPSDQAAKPAAGDEVMLNFDGADLREVVKAIIVDFLRETYIMDSKVQGLVSLHTTSPIPRSALLPTLETLLRMNGAAVVKEEGIFKVVPAGTVMRGSVTPQLGGGRKPIPTGYTVQIVPLKFISAKEMAKILEPYATEAAAVRIDEPRNLMILAGTEAELRHLTETVDMFDVDWLAGMSIGLFTLQSVDVKTAVGDLDKVFAAPNSPLTGVLRFVPIERLNAILVITPQAKYLDQARTWIERLDRTAGAGGGTRLFVYAVQNGQAEKLAGLVNDLFSKAGTKAQKTTPAAQVAPGLTPSIVNTTQPVTRTPAPAPAPGQPAVPAVQPPGSADSGDSLNISGDVRVIADKDNNALLILASPSDYEKIESAIRKLDIVPRQVLVDVTIAEVTLSGDLQFGLSWYFANSKTINGGTLFNDGNRGTINPVSASGPSGAQYIWSNARVGALVNLLQSDSRARVISSPHIMVTENQVAKINVGQSISVTTQQQSVVGTGTGILTGTQYVATGIILSVTPHIHAGGLVTLEVDQQVTTPGDAPVGTNPPINTRAIQSTIAVKSGETMVLGGLIQDQTNLSATGLPGLSQIPVVGGLFGSQARRNNRVELVMLITPRVVENTIQAKEVGDEFRRKLSGLSEYFEKTQKFEEKPADDKKEGNPVEKK